MMGELDIVARKRRDIVFVEVKAGSSKDAAYRPEVHVTGEKIKRLKRAAQVWLSMKRKLDAPWQIDVIAVDFSAGKVPRLRHTPRAAVE